MESSVNNKFNFINFSQKYFTTVLTPYSPFVREISTLSLLFVYRNSRESLERLRSRGEAGPNKTIIIAEMELVSGLYARPTLLAFS